MSKQTIALCFSGQLRCHHKIIDFWRVYFLDTFSSEKYEIVIFYFTSPDRYYEINVNTIKSQLSEYELVIKSEEDKDFTTQLPKIFNRIPSKALSRGGHNQMLMELHAMDSVIGMKREYEKDNDMLFDFVIRTRPDVIPMGYFNTDMLDGMGDDFIITNHDHHAGINGRFTICNTHISDKMFSIINTIEKTLDDGSVNMEYDGSRRSLFRDYFDPEPTWELHVNTTGVNVKLIEYYLYIIRDHDPTFPTNEHGVVALNGNIVGRFPNKDKINIEDIK